MSTGFVMFGLVCFPAIIDMGAISKYLGRVRPGCRYAPVSKIHDGAWPQSEVMVNSR